MRMRTAAAVVAAAVTATVMAGCSTYPGAAAVVDGRTISQSYLDEAQQDLATAFPGLGAQTVLTNLVVAPYLIEAAEVHGVAVSEDDARVAFGPQLAQVGVDAADLSDGAIAIMRAQLAAQNLQTLPEAMQVFTAFQADILAAEVTVNPRYGSFDIESRQVVSEPLPWLHVAG